MHHLVRGTRNLFDECFFQPSASPDFLGLACSILFNSQSITLYMPSSSSVSHLISMFGSELFLLLLVGICSGINFSDVTMSGMEVACSWDSGSLILTMLMGVDLEYGTESYSQHLLYLPEIGRRYTDALIGELPLQTLQTLQTGSFSANIQVKLKAQAATDTGEMC